MPGAGDLFLLGSLGRDAAAPPDLAPDAQEELWTKARTHCLTPYLHARWTRTGVIAALPEVLARRFAEARRLNTERNRRIAVEMSALSTLLEDAGVEVLHLKGLDLAQRFYGDLGLRVLYDLDLLVRPAARARALEVLARSGYTRYEPRGRAATADLLWRPQEYGWDAEGVFDPARPLLVDLQTRLWEEGWHGFRVAGGLDLWNGHRFENIAGARVRVPREEELAVELAVHYAFNALESHARLMHLVDVALLIERTPALDWERVLGLARANGVSRFCYLTLALAARICAAPVPEPVRLALGGTAPSGLRSWLGANGAAAAAGMNLYDRDRRSIYALHWRMAAGARETLAVLGYALRTPWREESGVRRYSHVARRMASRLRHLLLPADRG